MSKKLEVDVILRGEVDQSRGAQARLASLFAIIADTFRKLSPPPDDMYFRNLKDGEEHVMRVRETGNDPKEGILYVKYDYTEICLKRGERDPNPPERQEVRDIDETPTNKTIH